MPRFAVELALAVLFLGLSPLEHPSNPNKLPRAAKSMLEESDKFELLSLAPARNLESADGDFHGYGVLGKVIITDPQIRKRLVSAFERGIEENQGEIAACFNPRHGIHLTRNGNREDFVICFECRQAYLYGVVETHVLISASPQPVFDKALLAATTVNAGPAW